MSFLLKRFIAPSLAVLAVAALAPAAADAALGGGNAVTTSTKPDLRSATVLSSPDSLANRSNVRACFDKPVQSSSANAFSIGIYRTSGANQRLTASNATNTSGNCVDLAFDKSNINPYTYLTADVNAVTVAGGNTNLADSTALIGAATNNGTAGFSTAPDLTGVQAVSSHVVRYLFDQNVTNATDATKYVIVDSNNRYQFGKAIDNVDKNVVTVSFEPTVPPAAPGAIVDALTAVKAYTNPGAASADAGGDPNVLLSVNFPGFAQTTLAPDLQSASISGDGSTVDFVYDVPVTVTGGAASTAFSVVRSDGTTLPLTNPTVVNNNTVRVQLNQGTTQGEYLIAANANNDAVESVTPSAGAHNDQSTPSGLKVGDNDGAFASGFTTGTDAVSVSFGANGVASLVLDQRFGVINSNQIRLIAADGTELTSNPVLISGKGGPAARTTVQLQFVASELSKAVAVQLLPTAFTTFTNDPNVVQVISAAPAVG